MPSSDDQKKILIEKLKRLKDAYLMLLKRLDEIKVTEDRLYKDIKHALDQAKMEQILNKIHKL